MDILPVMELDELPEVPADYVPSEWALAVAYQLEKFRRDRVPAVLVHLESIPRYRYVGPARTS